jgi:hypothetical protein
MKWDDSLNREVPTGKHHTHFIAFRPTQVKSAISARQFDTTDPDITKADGGRIHANKGGKMGARADFLAGNHPDVPNVLYHGNAPKIATKGWTSEIDPEQTKRNIDAQDFRTFKPSEWGNYGKGIYLSDSPKVASDFAQGIRADRNEAMPFGQVLKLHASIKQPFTDDALRHPAWIDYIKGALTKYSLSHDEDRNARDAFLKQLDDGTATVRDMFVRDTPRGTLVNQWGNDEIHDTIRNSGFDGIIAHRPDGSKEYVAFKPEQVKSATGNQGTFDPNDPDMTKADGGSVTAQSKDGSGIFGEGAVIHRYVHPETGSHIEVLERRNGPASVLGLEVPEEHRGKGIGQMLQAEAMARHPALMGQVSSKAAATTAYRLGRRPYSAPDASLYDVFSAIDRDSSVNMLTPQAQPKADGGSVGDEDDGIDAYHGSPHDFDEFNIGRLGTGEGAQAYGHGLYFAGNESIAKHYRDALSGRQYRMLGSSDEAANKFGRDVVDIFEGTNGSRGELTNTLGRLQNNVVKGLHEAGVNSVDKLDDTFNPLFVDDIKRTHDRAQRLASFIRSEYAQLDKGHMYKVKLNVQPHELLDWDAPLAQQPAWQKVRQHWDNTKGDPDIIADRLGLDENSTGQDLHRALSGSNQINAAIALSEAGLKGIKYRDAGSRDVSDGDPTHNYVMFHHDPVKVVDKYEYGGAVDKNYDRIRRADGGRLNLYSKAAQVVRGMSQNKGSVDQMMAAVAAAKGVKSSELAQAGRPKGDTITKKELAQHFEGAIPEVHVTKHGEVNPEALTGSDRSEYNRLLSMKTSEMTDLDIEKQENLEKKAFSPTRHGDYILPGGTNYREHLLHLPQFKGEIDRKREELQNKWDVAYNNMAPKEELDAIEREFNSVGNYDFDTNFHSDHWRTPNVIAHLRMDDRDNGKTMHVQEVQSDWGQNGRTTGFYDPKKPIEVFHTATGKTVHSTDDIMEAKTKAEQLGPQYDYAYQDDAKVPHGPYVGNTQQWTDLAIKHALTEAAKGGHDRIVFSPGEANADLYGQRKPITKAQLVKAHPESGLLGYLYTRKKSASFNSDAVRVQDEKHLNSLLGKRHAKALLSQDGPESSIHEPDMVLGGHGMVDYYNNIVHPSALKLLQQHDPSIKPEGYDLPNGYKGYSLPMTDTARKSILENGWGAWKRGGAVGYGDGGSVGGKVVYQGRSSKGIQQFFNPNGHAWGTTDLTTARQFAGQNETFYPGAKPRRAETSYNGEVHKLRFNIKNPMRVDIKETLWDSNKEKAKIEEAKAKGHDGLEIYHNPNKSDFVAFDPDQVEHLGSSTPETTIEHYKRGGTVDDALALTRRFTKDGQHVTMRLKD